MNKLIKYQNSLLDSVNRTKRRINSHFKQSMIKRIKVFVLIALIMSFVVNPIFAIENTNIQYGKYNIECVKDEFMYITYNGRMQPNYMYHYTKDGVTYPVYCLNLGLKGAEDFNGYTVNGDTKIADEKLLLILLNGYPYKSVGELGLNSEYEAKFATQFAIWCYLENLDINSIAPISDLNIQMVECIKNMYYSKDKNISDYHVDIDISEGDQELAVENDIAYYTKKIDVIKSKNIINYELKSENSDVTISKLSQDEYLAKVPVNKIESDKLDCKIKLNIDAKENVSLFGKTTIDGFQDVAITLKDSFDTSIDKSILFVKKESKVKVIKKDRDSNEVLSGVEYDLLDENSNIIDKYTTDKNGEINITFNDLNERNGYLKETKAKDGYRLNEEKVEINIKPGENITKTLYNEKSKGTIEIIKKTKEYNEITKLPENYPLKDVEFEIIDDSGNVVDKVITNEYGIAKTKELPLGKYTIKETKTNTGYKLLDRTIDISILEYKDNVNVQVLNDNINIVKKLPVTGR